MGKAATVAERRDSIPGRPSFCASTVRTPGVSGFTSTAEEHSGGACERSAVSRRDARIQPAHPPAPQSHAQTATRDLAVDRSGDGRRPPSEPQQNQPLPGGPDSAAGPPGTDHATPQAWAEPAGPDLSTNSCTWHWTLLEVGNSHQLPGGGRGPGERTSRQAQHPVPAGCECWGDRMVQGSSGKPSGRPATPLLRRGVCVPSPRSVGFFRGSLTVSRQPVHRGDDLPGSGATEPPAFSSADASSTCGTARRLRRAQAGGGGRGPEPEPGRR